jgi:nitrogen fixation protein
MAQTSHGRMEALQVMGQMISEQPNNGVQQLMKLWELMLADMFDQTELPRTMNQKQEAG